MPSARGGQKKERICGKEDAFPSCTEEAWGTHVEMSSSERNQAHGCCGQAEPSENPGSAGWRRDPGSATEFL